MGSHYGEWTGETKETPGMVRWYNDSHYFLKRRTPESTRFVLGLENRWGQDGAYEYSTSIEFDNDEAPDLMDRIAKFNNLPKYTDLLEKVTKLQELVDRSEEVPERKKSDVYFDGFGDGFKACITGIKSILKGS